MADAGENSVGIWETRVKKTSLGELMLNCNWQIHAERGLGGSVGTTRCGSPFFTWHVQREQTAGFEHRPLIGFYMQLWGSSAGYQQQLQKHKSPGPAT